MRFTRAIAALLVMAAPQVPARALAQPAQADEVVLRFNPPTGQVLHYRSTKARFRKGVAQGPPTSVVYEWRFERNGAGFIAYWRIDASQLPPSYSDPQVSALIMPTIKAFSETPVAFDMDGDGNFVRVRDWEAVKKRIRASFAGFRALTDTMSTQERGPVQKMLDTLTQRFVTQTAEAAPQLLLEDFANMFSVEGFRMRIGQVAEGDTEVPVALVGGTVKMHTTITLVSRDGAGRVTVDHDSHYDSEDFARVLQTLLKTLGASAAVPPDRMPGMEQLKALDVGTRVRQVFDQTSGLALSMDSKREAKVDPGSYNSSKIERID